MGYKVLGYVVWRSGKWWVRRKVGGAPAKLAVAGLGVAVVGGVVLAGRHARSGD